MLGAPVLGLETGVSAYDTIVFGLQRMLPIVVVSYGVGLMIEGLFSVVRKEEVSEGYLVSGMLIALIVPASTPLWQLAIGVAFSVVSGEVFMDRHEHLQPGDDGARVPVLRVPGADVGRRGRLGRRQHLPTGVPETLDGYRADRASRREGRGDQRPASRGRNYASIDGNVMDYSDWNLFMGNIPRR